MKGRAASFLFLAICIGLAVLLLADFIDAETSGWTFAVALVVLGLLSGGFRRR